MLSVGVLASFEAKTGNEAKVERFLEEGLATVRQHQASTIWFAFRLGLTSFGAFAAFASEEEREALLSVGGPVAAQTSSELFAHPPRFQKVDILAAKLPCGESKVPVGSLVRFEARSGKEPDFEHFLKEALVAIHQAPGTTAWFAFLLGASTYGVFDAFPDEKGRVAHFLAGAERARKATGLLEVPPLVEKVDILAVRLPE